jgi:hypothetical protein
MYIAECDKSHTLNVLKVTANKVRRCDDISGKEGGEMVSQKEIDAQLDRVGMKNRYFGRPEIKELCHIIAPGEIIQHAVNGQYEGGFAMVIATDRRILLIDKKPWFLTMEDIRYDMVQEVDYYARLLDASVNIITFNKQLHFRSWRQVRLRELVRYIQQRVMDLRQTEGWQDQSSQMQPAIQAFSQQPAYQNDFARNYQAQIKRHSLAHLAGQVAIAPSRIKPIIKPLYPRPSLIAKYRQGRLSFPSSS